MIVAGALGLFLCVSVDGARVACADTAGGESIEFTVTGTPGDIEYATMTLSGGRYSGPGRGDHRVFISELSLEPEQVIEVALLQRGSHRANETPPVEVDTPPLISPPRTPEDYEAPRSPWQDSGVVLRVVPATGSVITLLARVGDRGFTLRVKWNYRSPRRLELLR